MSGPSRFDRRTKQLRSVRFAVCILVKVATALAGASALARATRGRKRLGCVYCFPCRCTFQQFLLSTLILLTRMQHPRGLRA